MAIKSYILKKNEKHLTGQNSVVGYALSIDVPDEIIPTLKLVNGEYIFDEKVFADVFPTDKDYIAMILIQNGFVANEVLRALGGPDFKPKKISTITKEEIDPGPPPVYQWTKKEGWLFPFQNTLQSAIEILKNTYDWTPIFGTGGAALTEEFIFIKRNF